MKRSLGSQEDVVAGREAAEGGGGRNFLSIPDTKTPWYILSMDFSDGYNHWLEMPNGRKQRVVCMAEPELKGWDPDNCPICEYMLGRYNEARDVRAQGEGKQADEIKGDTNEMRAKFEAHFIAVRGQRVLIKTAQGKKAWGSDFDMEDDESKVEVGVLSLSQAQFLGLTDMIEDENIAFIKSGDDLCNRVVWTEKIKQGRRRFKEVRWSASKIKSDPPEVEVPEELSVGDDFEPDEELMSKVYSFIVGEDAEDIADDEEVEVEGDSEDEPDDAYLDDVEEDEDEEKPSDEPAEEEDFEDDIPWEEEETPKAKKTDRKSGKTKTHAKVSGSKSRKAGATEKSTGKAQPRSRSAGKSSARTAQPKSRPKASSSKSKGKTKSGKTTL